MTSPHYRLLRVLVAVAFAIGLTTGLAAQSPDPGPFRFARGLDAVACDHVTTVSVTDAWDGAQPLAYALVPQGAPAPDPGAYDAVVRVPVRRVVSLATPVLAHLADMEALDTVVGVDSGAYIYNRDIRRRLQDGSIREVGAGADLDLERLIALDPDVVLVSVYGPDDPVVERIRAAGVPVIVFADWREADPLGRAEWGRLVGMLLGRSAGAEARFATRVDRYTRLRDRVAEAISQEDRPTIMTNAPWQGSWPVPAGDSYMARLFGDAGGAYLWADTTGTGSRFLDLETVLVRAADADVWINGNVGWRALDDVVAVDPRLATFAPFRNCAVYHNNGRVRPSGANDFWESGAARPDVVLEDLVRILHPALLPDHELVYYRRLDP